MRDHKKLRAFELADDLALKVYRATVDFPREEQFGVTAQMRKAAVSTASNIVEGCARGTEADYLRFLDMAYGSSKELEYQVSLSHRLGYLRGETRQELTEASEVTSRTLNALIRGLRRMTGAEIPHR